MNALDEKIRNTTDNSGVRRSFSKNSLYDDVKTISNIQTGTVDQSLALFKLAVKRFKPILAKVDFRKGVSTDSQIYKDSQIPEDIARKFVADWIEPHLVECQCNADPEPTVVEYIFGKSKVFVAAVPIFSDVKGIDGAIALLLNAEDNSHDIVISELEALSLCVGNRSSQNDTSQQKQQGPLQVLSKVSAYKSTKELGFTLANLLADRFRCEQVAFGEVERKRATVTAISGVANFKANSPGVAKISQAMEECVDSKDVIVSQRRGEQELEMGYRLHQQWSQDANDSAVCSVPLTSEENVIGVVSFRRSGSLPFSQSEIEDIQQRIHGFGPAIELIKKANASPTKLIKESVSATTKKFIGPGAWGRKVVAGLLLLAAAYFFFGSTTYTPSCVATLKPAKSLQVSAPFNTVLKAVYVEAGDNVSAGTLLFEMDTKNIELELAAVTGEIGVTEVQMREALAEGKVTEAALHRNKIIALTSSRQVLHNKIAMSRVTATADGIVTECELTPKVGQVFRIGEPMLQLSQGDDWKVEIDVPDYVTSYVLEDQVGVFATKARPGQKFDLKITQVSESAELADAENVFVAMADIDADADWLKSGMQGFVKIKTVSKPVWWVSLHRLIDTARINFWF